MSIGPMQIVISGELYTVEQATYDGNYLALLVCGDKSFYVASERSVAQECAMAFWLDMLRHDPALFTARTGMAADGAEEWVSDWYNKPEEFFSVVHTELTVDEVGSDLVNKTLGFTPGVAYENG